MLFAVPFQFGEFKSVNVSSLHHTLNKGKPKKPLTQAEKRVTETARKRMIKLLLRRKNNKHNSRIFKAKYKNMQLEIILFQF